MCRPVRCKTCGKTTWAGCGQHVAQVKASVPAGQWCAGHSTGDSTGNTAAPRQGRLAKLLGLR
jgi:hypothetical protein